MLCPIDIYPGIILYRATIGIICLDLVQLYILLVTCHEHRGGGLLTKGASMMVTIGQAEVNFAGGIIVADIVELVRIVT